MNESRTSTFQIVIIAVFIIFALIAVAGFAGIIPFPKGKKTTANVSGTYVIWGTIPQASFDAAYNLYKNAAPPPFFLQYTEKDPATFDHDLVEQLASGRSPDMIILPQDLIIRYADKAYPIPFATFPERTFRDTFIDEATLYVTSQGIMAFPLAVDPMVMYWNNDLLSSAGLTRPPQTWAEFLTIAPLITKTDESLKINKSAIAFGEFRNITHAKDVLATLLMQAGNTIVAKRDKGYYSTLGVINDADVSLDPVDSSVNFYTQFSNPVKSVYSWNRSLPNDKDSFISGDLAFYFGYASEFADIQKKNPHLNFDVAMLPQPVGASIKTTFGKMYALALLRTSPKLNDSFVVINNLISANYLKYFEKATGLPPVRRDMLATKPNDAVGSVFYDSALISKAWLDPEPSKTDAIFKELIEGITSGRNDIRSGISRASQEIQQLVGN